LEQAIDLRFDLRNALYPLGQLEAVFTHLRDAERLAKVLEDQRRLGWVSAYMSHYLWWRGQAQQAREYAESAGAIADQLGDFPLQLAAKLYLGFAWHTLGECRQAATVLRHVVGSLRGDLGRERFGQHIFPAVNARSHLVWAQAESGEFEEALVEAREAVRLAEELDHPYSLSVAWWALGSLFAIRGQLTQAVPPLERALVLCRESNLAVLSPLLAFGLGCVYTLSGRVSEGLALLRQAVLEMESKGLTLFHSLAVVNLGEAYLAGAQQEEASSCATRALALARERGERGYEACALHLLGEIASYPPDVATAEGHFGVAMALASELGMRPLVTHCHLGLGKLYRRTGQRDQAHEHLTIATTMYRGMDMPFWLEQAEEEMRALT
jgi:tetratricopeptide (TPR) repeat protein